MATSRTLFSISSITQNETDLQCNTYDKNRQSGGAPWRIARATAGAPPVAYVGHRQYPLRAPAIPSKVTAHTPNIYSN